MTVLESAVFGFFFCTTECNFTLKRTSYTFTTCNLGAKLGHGNKSTPLYSKTVSSPQFVFVPETYTVH